MKNKLIFLIGIIIGWLLCGCAIQTPKCPNYNYSIYDKRYGNMHKHKTNTFVKR